MRPGGLIYFMVYPEPERTNIDAYRYYHEVYVLRQLTRHLSFELKAELLKQVQGERWALSWFDAISSRSTICTRWKSLPSCWPGSASARFGVRCRMSTALMSRQSGGAVEFGTAAAAITGRVIKGAAARHRRARLLAGTKIVTARLIPLDGLAPEEGLCWTCPMPAVCGPADSTAEPHTRRCGSSRMGAKSARGRACTTRSAIWVAAGSPIGATGFTCPPPRPPCVPTNVAMPL